MQRDLGMIYSILTLGLVRELAEKSRSWPSRRQHIVGEMEAGVTRSFARKAGTFEVWARRLGVDVALVANSYCKPSEG